MPPARDDHGRLVLGGVDLAGLARDATVGTPAYVYDLDAIAADALELRAAFDDAPHLVAYAVKANSAGPVVRALAATGCGADVVSGAELALSLECGILPEAIVYSGVAKTDAELDRAIACGPRGVRAVQIESIEELARVDARAHALGRIARVSLRVNPAVELVALDTHAHIATGHDEAKFGIPKDDMADALAALDETKHLELVGVGAHIGSQFTSTDAYVAAARALFALVRDVRPARGAALTFVDTGGGFGIDYGAGCPVRPRDFVRAARAEQRASGLDDLALFVEPGRSLVAAHGVLLARVIQAKVARHRTGARWLMIDAGMNDLIRPALYQARHRIVSLEDAPDSASASSRDSDDIILWRVVGPVCESSDDFGAHLFPRTPPRDVAILDCGAYGFTMASRYNGRALPAEVFLRGGAVVAVSGRRSPDEWSRERAAIG